MHDIFTGDILKGSTGPTAASKMIRIKKQPHVAFASGRDKFPLGFDRIQIGMLRVEFDRKLETIFSGNIRSGPQMTNGVF